MHHSLVWLTVEAKLTSSIITFSRNAIMEGKPDFFRNQILNAGLKHSHNTRQVSPGYFQNQLLIYLKDLLFIEPPNNGTHYLKI